jgi:general secretion pathway protein L
MSLLVIQISPKPRLHAREQRGAVAAAELTAGPTEFSFVWSPDGQQVAQQGRCTAPLLPKADSVVAVVGDADLSWHRITLPKAPPARLRAALAGVLEEALLDDADQAHLALAPQARPGEATWVAAAHRSWLAGELNALEAAQVFVDRVVPSAAPMDTPVGHFSLAPSGTGELLRLCWAHAEGVATVSLQGGLARALLPQPLPPEARFTASPGAAALAETWLGAPVGLVTDAARLLQAAQSPWDLRQFDLVRRHRGSRALRDGWRALLGPEWRPVRVGLVVLVAVQLIGLNLWAWTLRDRLTDKRAQMTQVLQASFPQVRAVLDAPVQMEREVQQLRSQAGKAGGADLEPLLLAAAAAWPPGRPPVDNLRFEPGRLSLAAAGWSPDDVAAFGARLRAGGLAIEQSEGRLTISRAARGGRT